MLELNMQRGWQVLQDVNDSGENLGIYQENWEPTTALLQTFSAWEPIDRLEHLQLIFSKNPYFGRELRYFNNAPWWYKNEFHVPDDVKGQYYTLRFEGVDYYCKVWLNGTYLGEHEGYATPFEFEAGAFLKKEGLNTLVVKVWSPWDKDTLTIRDSGINIGPYFDVVSTVRNMIKGTYAHSDGFIQRDINPVGIWREVKLRAYEGIRFNNVPHIITSLSKSHDMAEIKIRIPILASEKVTKATLRCAIVDNTSGIQVALAEENVALSAGYSEVGLSTELKNPKLWNTWDRGNPSLYTAKIEIWSGDKCLESECHRFGIRSIELRRTSRETTFSLNGHRIFLRGTLYFPDVYISSMHRERYLRDLKAIRDAGCNCIRVHVHVDKPEFYDLCDELGLAVIQDSDLSWIFPTTEEFKDRALKVIGDMIVMLRNHPAIICWICMNEPDAWLMGVKAGVFKNLEQPVSMLEQSPGPQLVAEVKRLDPSRPYIKGSYSDDDESGDSHTYEGSLVGQETHYTGIDGTTEKLNTEYGFDAPGSMENLKKIPRAYEVFNRMDDPDSYIKSLQYYQYRLLKYYIEHYRRQKYNPCSGCFQCLFTDIVPQSFYGVLDWWGLPKKGLRAFDESCQPVGIFMEYTKQPVAIWVVNDLLEAFPNCILKWTATDSVNNKVCEGSKTIDIGADSVIRACDLSFPVEPGLNYNVMLSLENAAGKTLARNEYIDAFNHPDHPEGHPLYLDQELGMRLYGTRLNKAAR